MAVRDLAGRSSHAVFLNRNGARKCHSPGASQQRERVDTLGSVVSSPRQPCGQDRTRRSTTHRDPDRFSGLERVAARPRRPGGVHALDCETALRLVRSGRCARPVERCFADHHSHAVRSCSRHGVGCQGIQGHPLRRPTHGRAGWRSPTVPEPRTDVRDATRFGPRCPQTAPAGAGLPGGPGSEDCLTINVWTPAKSSGDRLPVMVWIHGGGFTAGTVTLPASTGPISPVVGRSNARSPEIRVFQRAFETMRRKSSMPTTPK